MERVLILGTKEYPMGTNRGDDPIPSGGMETYIDDIAEELSKYVYLVIVTRKFKGTKSYEKTENIEVHRVPWIRGRYFRSPSFNSIAFIKSLQIMKRVGIIYAHGIFASFFGYVLAKLFRKPIVCRPAGISFTQWPFLFRSALRIMEKRIYLSCNKIIFHSDGELKNFERAFGQRPRNTEIIFTGFPVEKFRIGSTRLREELGMGGKTVVTFIGRFVPVKGIFHLIEGVKNMGESVEVLLVGSGPQEDEIKRQIKSFGLEKNVHFLGFRRDIPEILAITDIFVVPSLSEGLPTSLLEAMAAGKACVVTDIGLPVEDGKNALVVPSGDSRALGKAIDKLIRNPDLRRRIETNALKFAKENCTVDKAVKRHIEVFSSLGT